MHATAGVQAKAFVTPWGALAAGRTQCVTRGGAASTFATRALPIGGATNIGAFVGALGPQGLGVRLAVLCDAAEEAYTRRGLERAGLGANRAGAEQGRLGVCHADLEDELIRALGPAAVERVLDAEGELDSFRRFQSQPAQRGRNLHAQLRRFMGTRARRKIRYGALLVDALDLDQVPRPLERVLACVMRRSGEP